MATAIASSPAMAASVQATGSPFDISSSQAPTESSPAVAMDDNGNYVVAWAENGGEIFAQTFQPDGTPISSQVPVNTTTIGIQQDPDVAMDNDGDFVVVWQSDNVNGYSASPDIVYRRFNLDASNPGTEQDVTQDPTISYGEPAVDLADDGRLVVAFEDEDASDVLAELYNASDQLTLNQFSVPAGGGDFYGQPDAAFTQSGEFVVAFSQFVSATSNDVLFQLYTSTGSSVIGTDTTVIAGPGNERNVVVDQDASGNFVIAWNNNSQESVSAQRVDLNGTLQGGTIPVAAAGNAGSPAIGVAVDDDGDFVVAWTSGYYDTNPGVYFRAFAPDGTADIGETALLQTSDDFSSAGVAVSPDSSSGVVTWIQADSGEGLGARVRGNLVGVPGNEAPIADAGPDQRVNEGATVTLDGSGSSDAEGDIQLYDWQQTAGPIVSLANSTSTTPSFTAPSGPATLSFQLEVTDEDGATATDSVTVTVNGAPVADAGPNQSVDGGTEVTLDATGSSDPDGSIASYQWTQPSASSVTLSDSSSAQPTFTAPPDGGSLVFRVTVTDNDGATASDDVVVEVNGLPVANAGPDQRVEPGSAVTLDGSGSSDPEGAIAAYSWTQTGGPSVAVSGVTSPTATFTAPETDATVTFELAVTDQQGATATDRVTVTAVTDQPPVKGESRGLGDFGGGSLGWLGLLGLGLAGLGRRLRRRAGGGGGLASLLVGGVALASLLGPPPAVAQQPPGADLREAGRVQQARGTVTAVRPRETSRTLRTNDTLYVGDLVRTGAEGVAVLRLADGSRITVRPDSEFRVARIEQTTNEEGERSLTGMVLDLLKGGLRAITGQVAERDPEQYRLRTPVATIGVRGTEFDARLCNRGQCPDDADADAAEPGPEPVARLLRMRGTVEARGRNGATRVLEPGAGVYRGDTVITGGGDWGVLQFQDGSKVSLQPETAFRVAEWEYDEAEPEAGNALLRLVRGGLRVLTGLMADREPDAYEVDTPVATIGIRGTGFDLLCRGTCVNPDVRALGSVQGDGLFVSTWDGQVYAQLEGRVAEFASGQSGFLANASAPPVRLPGRPPALQELPAPRPDRVTGSIPDSGERLYTHVREGAIAVQGATGAALAVGAGESAVVGAGGSAVPLAATPSFIGPGDTAIPTPNLLGALGALTLGQFDLATPYAGGTVGTGLAGDEDTLEERLQRRFPSVSVNDLSGDAGLRAFGGFRFLGLLSIEVGTFDMGETSSEIDPGTADPAAVAEAALDKHPITPRGVDVSVLAATPTDVTGTTWAFARTGVFTWEGEVELDTPSGETFRKEFSGTDPLVGGGVEYRIGPGQYARAEWIHYRLEPDPVNYVGAGVVWTFP